MRKFYCYSIPLKMFLKDNMVLPLSEEPKVNPNSGKHYWEYCKGETLDKYLSIWKDNKIKAIQNLKNNN